MDSQRLCPHCNAPVATDARFCRSCGESLSAPTLETPRYCPQCGKEVPIGCAVLFRLAAPVLLKTTSRQLPPTPSPATPEIPASKGCFTGWRKAAIITLIALIILCPPTGIALYFYGTSLDNDSPVNLDDIATIDYLVTSDDDLTIAGIASNHTKTSRSNILEVLGDNSLGDDSWSLVHIEPSDGSGAN